MKVPEYFIIYNSGGSLMATRVTAVSPEAAIQLARVEGKVSVVPVTATQTFTARRMIQVEEDV